MNQQLFIPLTDDLMYNTPEKITSGLRPYHVDTPCYNWQVSIEPVSNVQNDNAQAPINSLAEQNNVIRFPQELAA